MKKKEQEILVYYVMGFLESGKSSFLDYTMEQDYFHIDEPTLLITCEEGEVEFDKDALKERNTFLEVLESKEEFNFDNLKAMEEMYHPARVLVECNAFWDIKEFQQTKLPAGWEVIQRIVTVDATTFDVYMSNMKSIFMEMVRFADMVIYNRCKEEQPLANYRRSIKVVNAGADIVFENMEGTLIDIFDGALPYDVDEDIIRIEDVDYGIFYMDMRDHPKTYKGKKVKFRGRVLKSRNETADYFMPARMAMTCCADDTSHLGYACKSPEAKNLTLGEWVNVTAEVRWEWFPAYKEKGPVLYAKEIVKTGPPTEEMVYFN